MKRLGVVVNPYSGMGGSVGLKGTDGVVAEAQRRGARQGSPARAVRALRALAATTPDVEVHTCAGDMGHEEAIAAGLSVSSVLPVLDPTTAADTRTAAQHLVDEGVELLLFVGGDGTATDIFGAVGHRIPVVGVPGGVKMHSGVFARTPEAAGILAGSYLNGQVTDVAPREVMDVDEMQLRAGVLAPRLLGYLSVPDAAMLVQHPKRRGLSDRRANQEVGAAVIERLPAGALVAVGPGTTAGAVMEWHGLPHTLLGFDLVRDGELIAADVTAADLLERADNLYVVIAPTGGQGALLGRGNQQLTPAVLRRLHTDRLIVVATRDRLASLAGRPLLIDLDDADLATSLSGMRRVLVGPGRSVVYPVAGAFATLPNTQQSAG